MAKVEAGKMKLALSSLPMKSLLNDISMLVADMVSKKKLEMVLDIAEDLPNIEGDELKVKEIIYNLISNAAKFTPEGGKIGMRSKKTGSEIEIVVWDTGVGIAPENMGKPVKKIESQGNNNIILTERGYTFGYNDLVVDPRSFYEMRKFDYPVVFDITHSIRKYGIPSSDPKGGMREYLPVISRSGVAAGVDGIFIEVHPDPANAKCDAASQLKLADLEEFIKPLIEIHHVEKRYRLN